MSYAIHNVHSQARGEVPGAFLRDVRRWQAVEMLTMGRTLAIWQGERGIEAYVAFHVDTRDQKPVIEVHEIVSVSDIGRKAIVGFLAAQEFAQRIAGETNQSSFLELGLDQVPGISVARLPGVMLRIADLEAVLAAIAETGALTGALSQSRSGLTIRVDAGDGPHFEHPVRMFAIQKEAGPTCVAMGPADEIDGDWLGGEIGALTQMVCGHASASALHSAGRLRASSYEAVRLAEALFPLTDPYLPLPDLF
jgi:predicted acetyltransferase